jgi:hypothetical protein
MNYIDFITIITEEIKTKICEEIKVEVRDVRKNNGVILQGLTITSAQSNMSPTIYLNSFYEEYESGKSVDMIVVDIMNIYHTSKLPIDVDMDFFLKYELVKSNLYCRLINYEKNEEFLENVPYKKYFDLAMICYFSCEQEYLKNGFITITTDHLDSWGVDEEELFEVAWLNTKEKYPYTYVSMEQMIRQMVERDVRRDMDMRDEEIEDKEEWISFTVDEIVKGLFRENKNQMYVLSNEGKVWGAVSMLCDEALKEIANEVQDDLFILPSSVHEVIVIPAETANTKEYLKEMVAEVNRSHVEREEVLSDHIYRYLRDSGTTILQ